MKSFNKYYNDQINWSLKTFGEGKRTLGIIKHIKKELKEVQKNPDDLLEWIDVIILAMDGYWRHGGDALTLLVDLNKKQKINFKRKYPFPVSQDKPSEHIK
jgi:hypothetical protein